MTGHVADLDVRRRPLPRTWDRGMQPMREDTSQFVETIRNIYLHLNKNYTPYLKLAALASDQVDLESLFHPDLLSDYQEDRQEVMNLIEASQKRKALQFSDKFDFRTSDMQKNFGSKLLNHGIARVSTRLKALKRPITLLSLGIGDGSAAREYIRYLDPVRKAQVIGIDVHDCYLEQAQGKIPGLRVHRFDLNDLASGASMPLDDRSVDMIECAMVAHHIERFKPLVAEVGRLLKPGGSFFYLDLIDKTLREEVMQFQSDHQYPPFHGVEFFRDHFTIKKIVQEFLTIDTYVRVGPGILFLESRG